MACRFGKLQNLRRGASKASRKRSAQSPGKVPVRADPAACATPDARQSRWKIGNFFALSFLFNGIRPLKFFGAALETRSLTLFLASAIFFFLHAQSTVLLEPLTEYVKADPVIDWLDVSGTSCSNFGTRFWHFIAQPERKLTRAARPFLGCFPMQLFSANFLPSTMGKSMGTLQFASTSISIFSHAENFQFSPVFLSMATSTTYTCARMFSIRSIFPFPRPGRSFWMLLVAYVG